MARTLTAAALLAFAPLWAQPSGKPGRRDLARYVYPVKVHEGPAGRGAFHLGGGFFLSSDGDFLTVSHLFQNLRPPVSVAIAVDDRGAVAECPVESVAAFSRDLDFVIMRVNLGRSKARVPPIARSATVGEKVFGFIVQVSGPVGPSAGPQAKAGILPTEAIVSAVSPRRIAARGIGFLSEGSSGAPIFNAAGQALGIAQSVANGWAPESRRIYVSLPIRRALTAPRLAAPVPFSSFLTQLRADQAVEFQPGTAIGLH